MTATIERPSALGGAIAPIASGFDRQLSSRVPLRRAASDIAAMAWRHLVKMFRQPEQFFDVALQPVVFTLMFTYVFGGAIAGDVASYLPYLLPGIMVQSVVTTSMVTGAKLREDMDKGVFDRFKSLPMARIAPLAGALLADTLRYVLAALVTLAVGFAIGYRPEGGVAGVAAASLLVVIVAWAVSWIFALLGVVARSASTVQGLSMAVLFPLTFISNAYVPVETMPGWLQSFVHVNPISHLISAARELTMSGHWGMDVVWSLMGAAGLVAVFAPITLRAYRRRA
ncbi:MAG: ABC transporter permease [Bifidobacteriaceae bacterium]|jgi:ABC-2 type transport system permease protein|nr:ABC transporter permease [Bifidobacteriaceae bacterium]